MAEIMFLPRVLIGRTEHGTSVYWDRRQGLLATGPVVGTLRQIDPEELRRCYPSIWSAWLRLAAMLPVHAPVSRPGSGVTIAT